MVCTTNDVNSDCFIHALKFHLLIQYKDLLSHDQCKISMQDIHARYPQDLFVNHDGPQGQKKANCNTRVFGQRNLGC